MTLQPSTYKCSYEQCDKVHGVNDVNGWLLLWVTESAGLLTEHWDDEMAEAPHVAHVCGFDHATILFARWLSTGSLK